MTKAKKKKRLGSKRVGGGEKKKTAIKRAATMDKRDYEGPIAEGHDRKRNNIGPSGQGPHRGRERRNSQSKASGRSDVPSVGERRQRSAKHNRQSGARSS